MIKATELRIGNWIQDFECEPHYFQVEELRKYVGDEIWAYYRKGSIKAKEVSGIPLTEEILLKCGLYFDGASFNYYNIRLFGIEDYFLWIPCEGILIIIYHLHKLQNLVFGIIGEELTINL